MFWKKKKKSKNQGFIDRLGIKNEYCFSNVQVKSKTGFIYTIDNIVVSQKGVFAFNFNDENLVFYGNDGELTWVKASPKDFSKIEISNPAMYIRNASSILSEELNVKLLPFLIFSYGDVIHVDSPNVFNIDNFMIRYRNLDDLLAEEEMSEIANKIKEVVSHND